jgi:hypothetical protein
VQYVHTECLERWRRDAGGLNAQRCEICHAEYTIQFGRPRRLRACCVLLGSHTVWLCIFSGFAYLLQKGIFAWPEMVDMYHLDQLDREAHMFGRMLIGFIAVLWIIGLILVGFFVPCVGSFVFLWLLVHVVAALFDVDARADLLKLIGDRRLLFLNIGLASLMILSFLFGTSIYQCTNVGPGTVVDYRGMRPSREDRPDGAGDSSRNPFQARTFSAFRDFSATQYQRFQDFHTQHFLLTDHDPPGE